MTAESSVAARVKHNLLEGDVAAHLRRLAVPVIFGLMALQLFSVVDTYYISYLGTKSLAAFGFCIPIVFLFMGATFGLSVGSTSALSRVYGAGDMALLRRMTTDAISMTAMIMTAFSVIGYICIDPIFSAIGAKPELMPLIRDFMSYWYVGLPFLGIMMVGNACIRATGDTVFPSRMLAAQAILMMIVDPFLIFGWAGLPRLELKGAGLTLMLCYMVAGGVSLYMLGWRRRSMSAQIFHAGIFKSWGRILHVALPSIVSNQIAPISTAIITSIAARFGAEAVASLGVANRIENVVMLVPYSFNAAVAIFVGQNFGAGNFGRVREAIVTAVKYVMFYGLFMAVCLWFLAGSIGRAFSDDLMIVSYVRQYFHWVPISYGGLMTMIICNGSFTAMGRPFPSTATIAMKAFIIYIPLAYTLQKPFGFVGILIALMLTNMLIGIISYVWNRRITA